MWVDRRRLFATTGLAAAVAFPVLLCVASGLDSGISATQAIFIAKLLCVWLATMTVVRFTYGLAAGGAAGGTARARRILLLGDARQTASIKDRLRPRRGVSFEPVRLHATTLSWPLLRQNRIWGIVVADDPGDAAMLPLLDCKLRGMKVFSAAAFHEIYLGRIDLDTLTANDLLMTHGFVGGGLAPLMKRLGDIIVGLADAGMALPLMLLTALAIKLDSPGPVFYRQQRAGLYGKPFTLLKFRSMTADAEEGGNPRWAQQQDPRITRVGRFIRPMRIDELPQLINVLRGEMSMIGPRPERPHFVEQLAR